MRPHTSERLSERICADPGRVSGRDRLNDMRVLAGTSGAIHVDAGIDTSCEGAVQALVRRVDRKASVADSVLTSWVSSVRCRALRRSADEDANSQAIGKAPLSESLLDI